MKTHRRRLQRMYRPRSLAALACVVPLLAVSACSEGEDGATLGGDDNVQAEGAPEFDLEGKQVRITFGDNSAQSLGNVYVVDQLEAWGAEVEQITLTTATGLSAIIAGQADFAAGQGADEAVLGLSTGVDLTAIGAPDSANSYVIVARTEIESVEDLEGARLATSGPGGFNTALAYIALQNAGLNTDTDVDFVTIGGSPERSAALLTGQVDATVIFFADWTQIEAQSQDVKLLARMADLVPNIPDLYYFGNTSYWEENPDVALAVACANLQANAIISQDKDAFVDFASETIRGSDREVLAATYDELKELGNWPTEPEEIMNVEGLDNLVELMIQSESLTEPVDTSELVDLSYLEEAVDMGCGETA